MKDLSKYIKESETEEVVKLLRGKKGDKGDTGEKGDKGERGDDGKDGLTPENGKDGKDGDRGIKGLKGDKGIDGKDGKDGSPDTGKQIIEKVNANKTDKIKRSKIEGIDDIDNKLASNANQMQKILSFGGANSINIKNNGVVIGKEQTINFTGGTVTSVGGGGEVNVPIGGGGGSPGGSNLQVQFNDSGSFGGNSGFTFNKANGHAAIGPSSVINGGNPEESGPIPPIDDGRYKNVLTIYEQFTSPSQVGTGQAGGIFTCVVVNQPNNDLATNYVANEFQLLIPSTNTANYGGMAGMIGVSSHAGSGSIGFVAGVQSTAINFGSGHIDLQASLYGFIENDSGTVTDAAIFYADVISGFANNKYGLFITDVTGGSVSNHAIKTGLGEVFFGDKLTVQDFTDDGNPAGLSVLQLRAATGAYAQVADFEQSLLTSGTNLVAVGLSFIAGTDITNTDNSVIINGVQGVAYHSGSGTVTAADCFVASVNSDQAVTIANASNYHALGQNLTAGYTITNKFANFLGDDLPVSSKFYQIYTGVGQIHFGDKIVNYNNIATTGWGVPAIYGSGRFTAQTAAKASVATYTVGAADGSFIISANANITAFVAGTFNVTCTYTDETNTSQTLKLNFSSVTGTLGIALAATGPFEGIPAHIRAKTGTTITIATSGTFTSLTYNVEGAIQQIL